MSVDDQDMIDRLKGLPREGTEPDWLDLSRRINAAVGPVVPKRPWYRVSAWRWMIPLVAGGATVLAIQLASRETPAPMTPVAHLVPHDAAPVEPPSSDEIALYLDGEAVVVDPTASAMLDDDDLFADDEPVETGLLSTDDSWIDELDPAALGAVDQWLDAAGRERKKG